MKTAYPNTTQPVSITLYSNIPFDNTYKNHSLISSYFHKKVGATIEREIFPNGQQYNFLNRKNSSGSYIYKRWTLNDVFNFDFKNGLIGNVTLELTNEQTNANYLMVVSGTQRWFYFITSIVQSNLDTYILSLETDVLMTYGDEFLEGMKGIPVFTKRKHCKRYSDNFVFSHDFKNGESAFSNVKPNIIEETTPTRVELREHIYGGTDYNDYFKDILWAYVTTDIVSDGDSSGVYSYTLNDAWNPFSIICFPINKMLKLQIDYGGTTGIKEYRIGGVDVIQRLVGEGHCKSAKILPYPPFHKLENYNIELDEDDDYIYMKGDYVDTLTNAFLLNNNRGELYLKSSNGSSSFLRFGDDLIRGEATVEKMLLRNVFLIQVQNNVSYDYEENYHLYNVLKKPNDYGITYPRIADPKLLFSPFRKYCLSSSNGQELEYYVELLVAQTPITQTNETYINLKTITTAYAGDYSIFTYINNKNNLTNYAFDKYNWGKIGSANSTNYTYPVGEDALERFQATQGETFYQSKMASGITSGLTIAGGVGSVALGIAGAVGTFGMSTPASVALIAGGLGTIAGGTASLSNTIKSANAKIEDLKNTPDSINISGSSYAHDIAMNTNGLLPYFIKYKCSPVILNSANDWFYKYGYEVARQCYFNQLVKSTQSLYEYEDDNDLFGRTIFNYIQIDEDITTKINADIPYLIKQKLSNIFNQGITLWTFFGFSSLNDNSNETENYSLDKWLYKNDLDNTEYNGESY